MHGTSIGSGDPPSLPLSQLSRDTLLPPCAYGQLPKKSTVFLSTSFPGILSSSAKKEGVASRNSEEGLGAVSGLMNLCGKKTETLLGEQWQNGALLAATH